MISSKTIKKMAGATLAALTLSTAAIVPAVIARPHTVLVATTHHGDRDPRLHKALNNLLRAQTLLQNADKDSAGHREKALDLVQQAIDETNKAIRHDQ